MGKIKNFFARVRTIKNIEIYIALGLALIVVCIVFFSSSAEKTSQNIESSQSYIEQMENKLVNVLGNVQGVGKVEVAISYSNEGEKVYAYETTTTQNGDQIEQVSSLVTVQGEPLVVKTLTPKIQGVVVVAEGADDVIVKYKIIQVVVTLLDIDKSCVQVFS